MKGKRGEKLEFGEERRGGRRREKKVVGRERTT